MVINDMLSDALSIYNWVPQDGVISPFLFLIHINDISLNIDFKSDMSLFADNTNIFSKLNISLRSTLDNIYNLLKTRKLDLNPTNSNN